MPHDLLFALWYFIPAGVANMTPILAAKVPGLSRWKAPVDGGRTWRGKRVFDDHKTWRGIVTGVIAGILILKLQANLYDQYAWARSISQSLNYGQISILGLGFLLSFGALFGDMLKSLAKRQVGVPAGRGWFPFDQLDYIVGGLLLSSLYVRLSFVHFIWIIIVWFGMHLLFSYIGYLSKFKDSPI
jgi:CDP-2,3-bis-(O-geranylgeranyl)-sn-glycerol synthase